MSRETHLNRKDAKNAKKIIVLSQKTFLSKRGPLAAY